MGKQIISALTSAVGAAPTGALIFKGVINIPSDFPTLALVQNGWTYIIGTNVTDNDVTKTNTGQSFLAGDEIAWNGSNWSKLGSTALWTDDGTDVATANSPRNIKGNTLESTVVSGTSPLTVASNTLVTNLNADLLDGQHGSYYAQDSLVVHLAGSETITGVKTFNVGAIPLYSSHPTFSNDLEIVDKKYVDDSIVSSAIWNRSGTTISPKTANDDLDMRSGNIFASNYQSEFAFYVVSPTNTSGTRSFMVEALLTHPDPLNEASKVTFYGLYAGSIRNFMDYDGQTDITTHRSDLYEYNNGATSNSILLRYISTVNSAVNVIHNQQHMALNSVAAQKIYTQFECLVANATAGSEAGRTVLSAMNNGVLTPCLELDGLTSTIIGKKSLNMMNNDIFMVDPANPSATKSFSVSETLIGLSAGSEYGSVELKGLSAGNETTFIKHLGDALSLEGTLEFTALNIVHKSSTGNENFIFNDSSISSGAPSGTVHLDISNRAYNSISNLVPYSQIKSYQMGNTAGSEYGKYEIIVRENGAQVVYCDFDASAASIRLYKDVGIGATPDASARLDVTSTTKGFLPPRMTTAQRTAIGSPGTGLMVYDLTLNQWFGWNGSVWAILG